MYRYTAGVGNTQSDWEISYVSNAISRGLSFGETQNIVYALTGHHAASENFHSLLRISHSSATPSIQWTYKILNSGILTSYALNHKITVAGTESVLMFAINLSG